MKRICHHPQTLISSTGRSMPSFINVRSVALCEHTDNLKKCYDEGFGAAISLYTRIEVVLGSKHDRHTDYPGKGFSCCSSVPPGKCWHNTSIRTIPFPSKSFQIHHSPIILPFDAMQSRYRQRRKISHKEICPKHF
jgi:hypothetical protein